MAPITHNPDDPVGAPVSPGGGARVAVGGWMSGPALPGDAEGSPGRRGRALLWIDGFVSNISESFVANFTNPFALSLGATNTQLGLLSAFTSLASALALMPGARLEERATSRKRVVVVTGGGIARALLIAVGLMPLLVTGPAVVYALMTLVSLRAFVGQLGFPAWSTLVADLVPASMRGRYFGSRNIGLAIAALIFTPIAGVLAESIGLPQGYQANFIIAGIIGFFATAIFARIPEPPREAQPAVAGGNESSARALLAENPRFAAFTVVAFLWNLSLMVAGPFFSVYLVKNLGATPTQIGILAAINSVANIAGQRVWGRLNDRRGAIWVMALTGFVIPVIPLLWSFARTPWFLVLVEALAGFAWAGYGLASFNLMLGLAPPEQRGRFTAIYQASVFTAAFVGPLLGSVLINALSIRPLFWISAVGRLAASILFQFTVREPRRSDL
jgi:MFS family permease